MCLTYQIVLRVPVAGTAMAVPGIDQIRQVSNLPSLVVSPQSILRCQPVSPAGPKF